MSGATDPVFTILLPVHRGPELLPFAIASVLAQTRRDFELFVICDGAPEATAECGYAAADPRVRVFEHDKGLRHGEAYRDAALMNHARGIYVCQIADDDLWFPDHLTEIARLLKDCDFGNLTETRVFPDGKLVPNFFDLSDERVRHRMLTQHFGFSGPTSVGYRLSAYRDLAERWSPAPKGIWSDLYMWRKFLRSPHIRAATRHAITSLHFGTTPLRVGWTTDQRRAENQCYADLLKTGSGRGQLRDTAMREVAVMVGRDNLWIIKERGRQPFRNLLRWLLHLWREFRSR